VVRALRIPVDPDEPITELEVNALEDYQAIVGGYIEPVDVAALGITIYVNEEGLLRQLPLNSRATFLWWYFVPEARQTVMLVGEVLVVGLPNRNGESTDVPREATELLLNPGVWRVEVKPHGDPKWYRNQATYEDYFEAVVWAMVTFERWSAAEETRIVPVDTGVRTFPIRGSDAVDLDHPPAA
jgi:hypothetical protein